MVGRVLWIVALLFGLGLGISSGDTEAAKGGGGLGVFMATYPRRLKRSEAGRERKVAR